jgi:phasin family protein
MMRQKKYNNNDDTPDQTELHQQRVRVSQMINPTEQLSKLSLNGFEALFRAAQISLDSTERLVKLNFELSKQSLEENVKLTRELSSLKTPQEALTRLNKLATQNLEQAVANSRSVYDIVSETQAELGKIAESNFNELNKSVISNIDLLSKNAPAGSETAVNALKSGIAAGAAAINSMTKAAQQVAEFADSSVKAANSATVDAVKTAAKRSSAA